MLYMVIERYRSGPGPVYERAAARGRMLPDGLRYVSSWVAAGRHAPAKPRRPAGTPRRGRPR